MGQENNLKIAFIYYAMGLLVTGGLILSSISSLVERARKNVLSFCCLPPLLISLLSPQLISVSILAEQ